MESDSRRLFLGLSIVGLMAVVFFSIMYLGVFNAAAPASYSIGAAKQGMEASDRGGTYSPMMYSPSYHVFNFFNSGYGVLMFLFAIAAVVYSIDRVQGRTKSLFALGLALLGAVFLSAGVLIFVMGVHDLLTFTTYETHVKPTFTQQYGWIIESIVFTLVGLALSWWSSRIVQLEEGGKSVMPNLALPAAALFMASALYVFVFGLHSNLVEHARELSWLIEVVVFGGVGFAVSRWSDAKLKEQGAEGSFTATAISGMGAVLAVAATVLFLPTVHTIVSGMDMEAGIVIETVLFAVFSVLCIYAGEKIAGGEVARTRRDALIIPTIALFIAASVTFYNGVNGVIFSDDYSRYKDTLSMLIDSFVYGIALFLVAKLSERWGEKDRVVDIERFMGGIFMLVGAGTLLVLVTAYFTYYGNTDPEKYKLLADSLVMLGAGAALILAGSYIENGKKNYGKPIDMALVVCGALFALVSLPLMVLGFHELLYGEKAGMLSAGVTNLVIGAIAVAAGRTLGGKGIPGMRGKQTKLGEQGELAAGAETPAEKKPRARKAK